MSIVDAFHKIGYPRYRGEITVKDFQATWNLGPALKVDGIVGPKTTAAIEESVSRGGLISPHFRATEFLCHCGMRRNGCHGIIAWRYLLASLETYREHFAPNGLTIVSGYRCPEHNRAVGGATDSMHLYGLAADVPGAAAWGRVRALDVFAGIGYSPSTGRVVHVDRRDRRGHNSVTRPVVFRDGA